MYELNFSTSGLFATDWTVRDRIPVGSRFSAFVHTGTGAHQAYYTMGTGSFPGVKRTGRGVDHPLNLAPMLKSRVIPPLPSRPSRSVLGRTFNLYSWLLLDKRQENRKPGIGKYRLLGTPDTK